jgi:prolyl-tRNA editing enzyme YbaK/EbsC (Cys-tRNA(Pro) deacylase)
MALSKNSSRVQACLDGFGLQLMVCELAQSTRTAQEAADAVGCELGQIVKSLIFKCDEKPLLFLVSGKHQMNVGKVGKELGQKIEKADADFVRVQTGYPIGGVPPVAHDHPMDIFMDRELLGYDDVWAAAGTPNAVFHIKSKDLLRITGSRVINVIE